MTGKFPTPELKRFHRLQWKLTISYLITSVTVLCLLEIVVILIGMAINISQEKSTLEGRAQMLARAIGPDFPASERDRRQQLQAIWGLLQVGDPAFQGYLAIIDERGKVVIAAGDQAPATSFQIQPGLPASAQNDIQEVLSSQHTSSIPQKNTLHTSFEQSNVYAVAPLTEGTTTMGALVVKGQYERSTSALNMLLFFGASAIVFFIGAGVVGLAFGVVTARSFVRRLQYIATAVEGWSQGDFSIFVRDSSRDELGQLAHRLNQMAQQLQHLLRTRQDLATLEERNRLARDLHDSIKQQVFAVSLHISTTKAFIGLNEQAARAQVTKAEELIRQAQRELTTLIRELRPVALEGRNLADATREYVRSWQEQTGIAVELEVAGEPEASPAIESAFFRIVQEALANVARHSQADRVQIRLVYAETMQLTISDNGTGFDVQNRDHQGVGLSSMRERVQALGGHLNIQSGNDQGTIITVQCEQDSK